MQSVVFSMPNCQPTVDNQTVRKLELCRDCGGCCGSRCCAAAAVDAVAHDAAPRLRSMMRRDCGRLIISHDSSWQRRFAFVFVFVFAFAFAFVFAFVFSHDTIDKFVLCPLSPFVPFVPFLAAFFLRRNARC